MPNWIKVIVSGSNANLSTLSITNSGSTADSLILTATEDSSTAAPVVSFKRNSSSPLDADYLGQLKFKGENDADQEVVYAKITAKIQDASDGTEDGLIEFANKKAGSNNITARLKSDKLQLINGTELEVDGQVSASSFIGDGSGLTGVVAAGTVSGSAQTIANLPDGTISGSAQLTSTRLQPTDVTGSFTGSFTGDGSSLTGISTSIVSSSTVADTFTSATTHSVSHTLGTKDLIVSVYDNSDDVFVPARINTPDTSTVVLYMDPATTGRVVIGKSGHIVSGSQTAAYGDLTGTPSGIVSGSAQIVTLTSHTETFSNATAVSASHGLGTKNVTVSVYTSDDFMIFPTSIKTHDTNNVYVSFNSSRSGRIVITK